ncbi:hypothetical protein CGCSCA5_v006339 [Colletotrichum siamense]|nr:hypothetical protein CGCSCA5_v006339 [Colletotrichum siamense]
MQHSRLPAVLKRLRPYAIVIHEQSKQNVARCSGNSCIMHPPTAIILLALVGLGLAGNPQYKLSCEPTVPAAYQASFQAYAKRNCGTGEYGGKPGTWHDNTQTCEAPTPLEGNISGRYYHPIFASSLGGANISPRCNWLSA